MYIKSLPGGFFSKVKIAAWRLFASLPKVFLLSLNKGQLWAAVPHTCRLSTPLCDTYSEPSGNEDSPGTSPYIPYLIKNVSILRLSELFFGLFCWWFLRSGSILQLFFPSYIVFVINFCSSWNFWIYCKWVSFHWVGTSKFFRKKFVMWMSILEM